MADAEPTPAPKRKRKHKTQRPALSAQDVRFATLLFARGLKSVADCYIEAGFPAGPTPHATEAAAHRRVKKREVRQMLRDLQQRAADAAQVDANAVVQGLRRIAFSKLPDLFDARGRIKLPHEWPADLVGAIESVESEAVPAERTGRVRAEGEGGEANRGAAAAR